MISLSQVTGGTPYASYAYSYPHKTAYRPLAPPRALDEVWSDEPKDALYLYVHIPFCEMRCGFCNLFTTANPRADVAERYVETLRRQAERVRDAIGPARFARMAIGGGTPTYLSAAQLAAVFDIARDVFGVARSIPASVETSPRTADADKLAVLRDAGVSRISIGVQSFVESEVNSSGRAQQNGWVDAAIGRIRALAFAVLNLDLIYGLPGQSIDSWIASLRAALRWCPEELYLYPLYVRPLTGLGRWGEQPEDTLRLACYREGRELLLAEGYKQVSMRMFCRRDANTRTDVGTEYVCQQDGMVGIGCGARSYTRSLHYSSEYAVGAPGVREIIADYLAKPDESFAFADYGCELDETEQKRRWVIKSLLRTDGLDLDAYAKRFGTCAEDDFTELDLLEAEELIELRGNRVVPTARGLERSDAIGPWLYSNHARELMDAYDLR